MNTTATIYPVADPPDGYKITELFAWVAVYPNGGEGIISMDMEMPMGIRHVPLVTASRSLAERMKPVADKAAQMSGVANSRIMRAKMKHFRLVEVANQETAS